ncbi:MAG: cytidylate kinase-like family protein [Clostridiales bacterium]|jgi:cytidylate kinase|nr:cytidylate kinase-like family protein [Clostridiales bacterium]
MAEKIIITIDRKFGSGGHEVGKHLAETMGLKFYDDEFIAKTALETGLHEDFIRKNEENVPSYAVSSLWGTIDAFQANPFDDIQQNEYNLIRKLGEEGNCVIIGRSADYILRDTKHVSIFIFAPIEARLDRLQARTKTYHLEGEPNIDDREQLAKLIKKVDKNRRRHYEFYTDCKWGSTDSYDLLINTARTGLKGAASLIETYVNECDGYNILTDF